jgi:hypothetical protein
MVPQSIWAGLLRVRVTYGPGFDPDLTRI